MKKLFFTLCVVLICSVAVNAQVDTCANQTPGDVNNSGFIDISDLTYLVDFLRGVVPIPDPLANADVNGDCIINLDDIDYLFAYITSSGPPPVDCTCLSPDTCDFQTPGDLNDDGIIDITDLTNLVGFITGRDEAPKFLANADVNGDCIINMDDIDYLFAYISSSGPAPVDCPCISPDTCDFQTPGDFDNSGVIDISDLTGLVGFITGSGGPPNFLANADVNGDCMINLDDTDYLFAYISSSGPLPVDCTCISPDTCSFQYPGDVDCSGTIDICDLTCLVSFIFQGGQEPPILANADVNGDCVIDEDDITGLQLYIEGIGSLVDCTCLSPEYCFNQMPGDFNSDGLFDISDIVFFGEYIHGIGPEPDPLANADANGDCIINVGDSKHLYDFLFAGGVPPVDCTCENPEFMTICCWGYRGNVDYDPVDVVDINDLVEFVNFMFLFGAEPLCFEEADVNGSTGIDISDLVALVDYMFQGGALPESCP